MMPPTTIPGWIVFVLVILAGIFTLLVFIGSFLPRCHVAALALRTRKPPEMVWEVLTDEAASLAWRHDLIAISRMPDQGGRSVWRERYKGNFTLVVEIIEAVPPCRLVKRIAGEGAPFRGHWAFDLEPLEEGCRVRLTEVGEVSNPFYRFLARLLMDPTVYLERYLEALARRLGEAAVLEDLVQD
jgi:uncharacterized protein YndB with AHSA1/START domain